MVASKRIRAHLRGNIVAYLALFFALTGTAVATHPLGDNTIDSGDIINGQVFSADVANDNTLQALTGVDIRQESLSGGDILDNSLTGADINESTLGRVPSAARAPLEGYEQVFEDTPEDSTANKVELAFCPEGKFPVGGGASVIGTTPDVAIKFSEPFEPGGFVSGRGWGAIAQEADSTSASWGLHVVAICARVQFFVRG